MIRHILLLIAAATMIVATAAPVFGQSRGERDCLAQNNPGAGVTAEWVYLGPGQYECVVTVSTATNPGNPQSDNAATPKRNTQLREQPQQGQGIGGGAQGTATTLNCQYNNAGKLQANRSDAGCPDPQP